MKSITPELIAVQEGSDFILSWIKAMGYFQEPWTEMDLFRCFVEIARFEDNLYVFDFWDIEFMHPFFLNLKEVMVFFDSHSGELYSLHKTKPAQPGSAQVWRFRGIER